MPDLEIIRPRQVTRWTRFRDALRSFTLGPFSPKDRTLSRFFYGGRETASSVRVDEETSLTYAAVWNAVTLISGDIAKVPLPLYRRLADGGKEQFRDHRLYELMHDEPNPEMSSFVFRRTLQGHVLVWGNGYAEIERDLAGRPVALWPLMPWAVHSFRTSAGVLMYRVTGPSGTQVELRSTDVLHLSGFGLDGIGGYPPILKAMESIGLGLATEKFGATFFGNGSTFGGVISYPTGLNTNPLVRKENREAIDKVHTGVDRAHRFLTLYEGAQYQQLGIPPNHAQFLETRRFQIEETARWFNIPVHKLKELARSTNNNIEHQGIEYATDTLQPWFRMWEGELRLKLIPKLERRIQFFEHITEALTRGDSAAQGELISKQFSVGGITPNEIRSKFNMNRDPDGDDIYVPSNTMPADLARKYWEAQIDEAAAKAEAARRPPPAPVVAPPKGESEEVKALRGALELSRKATQMVEDRIGIAEAALAEEKAKRAGDVEAFAAEAERLRQARDWFALDAHAARISVEAAAGELGAVKADLESSAALCVRLSHECDDKRKLVEQAVEQANSATAERDKALADAEAAKTLAKTLESQRDAAAEGTMKFREAKEAAEAALATAQIALTTADSNLQAITAECETLKTDLATARAEIANELQRARSHRTRMLAEMRALFADATARLLAKESNAARKHQATPTKLREWVDRFYSLHVETARDVFRPLVGPWTALTGDAPDALLDRLVGEHIDQSRQSLLVACESEDGDEMAATLERTLLRWESERADRMADALVREGMAGRG